MELKTVVLWISLVYLEALVYKSEALNAGGEGVCVAKMSSIERARIPYTVKSKGPCGRKVCTVRKIRVVTNKVWREHTVCCQGWAHDSDLDICKPICSTGCFNGQCVAPATCQCDPPLYLDPERKNSCLPPVCHNPCINAICVSNDTCACVENTRRYNDTHCAACGNNYTINSDLTCSPICSTPCKNAVCTQPDTCECLQGYKRIDDFTCEPDCETCVNSVCVSPNKCSCYDGYHAFNSTTCLPSCKDCENGDCVGPDECVCHQGYRKEEGVCVPVCSQWCVNGYCSSPDTCSCFEGYQKDGNNSNVCKMPCPPVCNGSCDLDGECPDIACEPKRW